MRYEVNVEIGEETMRGLKDEGYSLYAFKAVKSSSKSGMPTVWFAMDNYLTNMSIGWTEKYRAYISIDDLIPNGIISTHTDKDIDFQQTMNVDKYGICDVVSGGIKEGIVINDVGDIPYTCGVSAQKRDGTYSTLCAFKLHGKNADLIVPIEKVLLMFATEIVETQTVLEKSLGPGILIDLTGVTQRNVSYDIDKGWHWGDDESWAREIPANSQLSPLLTQFSIDLQKQVRQMGFVE